MAFLDADGELVGDPVVLTSTSELGRPAGVVWTGTELGVLWKTVLYMDGGLKFARFGCADG